MKAPLLTGTMIAALAAASLAHAQTEFVDPGKAGASARPVSGAVIGTSDGRVYEQTKSGTSSSDWVK
jgi:hypothetical protein